ncbi:hypothetical protein FOCC_FOCC007745 [Frankliniella occidentalis]|nr:hypothetical protein FOCC_FOCC007745 [Frankliniella occidentalis]
MVVNGEEEPPQGNPEERNMTFSAAISLIPVFNGMTGGKSYRDFAKAVTAAGQLACCSDKQLAQAARIKLEGDASEYLDAHPDLDAAGWTKLNAVLKARFQVDPTPEESKQRLMNATQSEGESVREFATRVRLLGCKILQLEAGDDAGNKIRQEILNKDLLTYFKKGLRADIKRFVNTHRPSTLEEATEVAEGEESFLATVEKPMAVLKVSNPKADTPPPRRDEESDRRRSSSTDRGSRKDDRYRSNSPPPRRDRASSKHRSPSADRRGRGGDRYSSRDRSQGNYRPSAISLCKRSAVPKGAPRRFGDYTAEGIGKSTVRLFGQALITLVCEGYEMDFLFWVCEDEGVSLQEDMLIGLDFLLAFKVSVNCRNLFLEFPEFSTPLLPVRSQSSLVRTVFPARKPKELEQGADRGTGLADEPDRTATEPRPGFGAVSKDKGQGPPIERKIDRKRDFSKGNLDPNDEQAYRLSLGEYPVYLMNKVTLPPCTQTAVLVRPHRRAVACAGLHVIEPGAEERPDLNVAFTLVDVQKGQPFPIVLCNLSDDHLQVSKNTPLGYLVEATTGDPPSSAPIRRVGLPRSADPPDETSANYGSEPTRGFAQRPYSAVADGPGKGNPERDKRYERDQRDAVSNAPPPTPAELLSKVKLDHLDSVTRKAIEDLISEFHDIFAVSNERIGRYPGFKHEIPTPEGKIVRKASYRIPYALRQSFQNEIQRLLSLGIIVRSDSEWCNPCLFLVKRLPSGEEKPRLIIDCRDLNALTLPSVNYNTRTVAESLDFMAGKLYLSKMDVVNAFHCIELAEEDAHKTAFQGIHGEKYHYLCVDMALSSVHSALCYFDDVICATTSIKEHLESLREIFVKLRLSNLTIRIDKCSFLPPKMELLGFEIEDGKITPSQEKIKAVRDFPRPKDRRQLKGFLGLASWMRKYIPNFASYARPLNRLTRPSVPFIWSPIAEKCFQELKTKLTSEPIVLHLPDLSQPFTLVTDCSGFCQGALLEQNLNGEKRIIGYASKQLTPAEAKRSATERELGCVVWALKTWRLYLLGARGTRVVVDHKPILDLKAGDDHSALLTRMLAKIMPYSVTFEYLPGKSMPSDALSRIPLEMLVPRDDIMSAQASDEECQSYMSNLRLYPEFKIKDGVLVTTLRERGRVRCKRFRTFVPCALRAAVVRQHHGVGHLSPRKTYDNIKANWWFPRMWAHVRQEIKSCKQCAERNSPYQVTNAPLQEVPIPTKCMQTVDIDLVGPLPKSSKQHEYILSIKCEFSKFLILVPLKKIDSDTICRKIEKHLISRWGCPDVVKSDNAKNLCSQSMNDFLEGLKIKKIQILPYQPGGNSVEASHRTIGNILAKVVAEHKRDWATKLHTVALAMNSHVHESHGFQPHEVLTGRPLTFPWQSIVTESASPRPPATYAEVLKKKVKDVHAIVHERLLASSKARLDAKNKNRFWREFSAHDLTLEVPPLVTGNTLSVCESCNSGVRPAAAAGRYAWGTTGDSSFVRSGEAKAFR